MYKIEKNIPIPNFKTGNVLRSPSRKGTKFSKTMHLLNIGDSFIEPNKKMKDIHGTFSRFKKNYNKLFTARTVETGIRIWRIEKK